MISLRQHAISLAAVFLALAVGVMLGSGLLSNTITSGLRNETRTLHNQVNSLNGDKNVLNGKLGSANAFDAQMAGRMVHDALNGKSIVIFRAPDANDEDVDAVFRESMASAHAEAIKTSVRRVSRSLAPLGLQLKRVRASGYLLERRP